MLQRKLPEKTSQKNVRICLCEVSVFFTCFIKYRSVSTNFDKNFEYVLYENPLGTIRVAPCRQRDGQKCEGSGHCSLGIFERNYQKNLRPSETREGMEDKK